MTAQALAEHLQHAVRRMPSAQVVTDAVDGVFHVTRVRDDVGDATGERILQPASHVEDLIVLVLPVSALGAEPTVRVVVDEEEIQHGVYLTEALAQQHVGILNLSNGGTRLFDIEDEPLRLALDPILSEA